MFITYFLKSVPTEFHASSEAISGNCQKNGYNQRHMKNWKQYILGVARGASGSLACHAGYASGGMLQLIKWWHFSTNIF